MRRALPLAAVLFAAALVAAAAGARTGPPVPDERTAREEFLAGVEAHLRGGDADAAQDWARCLRLAVKGGRDESDCRLFSDMLQERLAPNAPVPDENGDARRAYVLGRDDYLRGAFTGADLRWHECLTTSDRDPSSRPDCLMALELIFARDRSASAPASASGPAPSAAASAAPKSAEQLYLDGVVYYQNGDYATAKERWSSCAGRSSDCKAGLGMIAKLLGPPAPEPVLSEAERKAEQSYLEGVIFYQKGDIPNARARWTACLALNPECRTGLDRLEKLWGSSTAPDGKK
jgi:tetratricopeptide (TPR) repeat protein